MLTNLAFVFICVRASSALVRTSAFLQPVVRGQVYIFEISALLAWSPEHVSKHTTFFTINAPIHGKSTVINQQSLPRMEPPPAISAASPPVDPPGVRDTSWGLYVRPYMGLVDS